jgi:hypothetical protein
MFVPPSGLSLSNYLTTVVVDTPGVVYVVVVGL